MRQKLLSEGANELSYEIREIVKKADQLRKLGLSISWENIGDPIQKHFLPQGKPVLDANIADEVTWARSVVAAYQDALSQGRGVVAVGGRMVDAANIRMATTTLRRAEAIASTRDGTR